MTELSLRLIDAIHDLWGMGLTVVPRPKYPSVFDAATPRKGMAYQWFPNDYDKIIEGWSNVTHDMHPGVFAPYGTKGNVEHDHMFLMERPKAEVDAVLQAARDKAQKNVDDWFGRTANAGLTGSVTVLVESELRRTAEVTEIGEQQPLRTKIPPELFEHMAELLRERDRLVAVVIKESPDDVPPEMAKLRTSCLELAIDTIRKKYAAPAAEQEARNG